MAPEENQNDQSEETVDNNAIDADALAEQLADQALAEAGLRAPSDAPPVPEFSDSAAEGATSSIDLLKDVELDVKIELGRAEMTVEDILRLTNGSVVELDRLAGDPVDILVNERLVARGEVIVVNENFCVRVNEIVSGATERLAQA